MTEPILNNELLRNADAYRQALLDDLYLFFFAAFEAMYNKVPDVPHPRCRRNHFRIMADKLMSAFRADHEALPDLVLTLNLHPRYGKSDMVCTAIVWCYAHNPAANNIYGSYKKELATEKTEYMRALLQSRFFQTFFDARLSKSSTAKDNFLTVQGGRTMAVGADGSGLGSGAGTSDGKPYGGGIVVDDILKAQDAYSRAMKEAVARLHSGTFVNRRNNPRTTPMINVSQRLMQDDYTGMLLNGIGDRALDNYQESWRKNLVAIPVMDEAGNALWPEKHDEAYWRELEKNDPITYYAQGQQQPLSSATAIFNVDRLVEMDEDPEILCTAIIGDTAETAERANDASAFVMGGFYDILYKGQKTGEVGLHVLALLEIRVEPDELVDEFDQFYAGCLRYPVKPYWIGIEKKNTGSMLLSYLKKRQGIIVHDIKRTSLPKTERFKKAAPYMAKAQVSVNKNFPQKDKLKKHLRAITIDESQRFDDIADALSDLITFGLDERIIYRPEITLPINKNAEILKRYNAEMRGIYDNYGGY
jgi:hypothetical protein